MKKRDGKIEHKENGVEKFFNLDKKLVEWIINEQRGMYIVSSIKLKHKMLRYQKSTS